MSTHSMVRRSSMRKSITSTPNSLEIQITPRGTPNRRLTKHSPKSLSCVVKTDSSAQKLVFVLGDFLTKSSKSRKSTNEDYFQQVYSDDSDISCSSTDSTNIDSLKRKAEEINNTLAILEAKKKAKEQNLRLREESVKTPACPQTFANLNSTNKGNYPKKRGRPRKNPIINDETPLIKRKRGRPRKVQIPLYDPCQIDTSNRSLSEDSLSDYETNLSSNSKKNPQQIQLSNASDEDRFTRYRSTAEACLHEPLSYPNCDSDFQTNALDYSKTSENTVQNSSNSEIAHVSDKQINYDQNTGIGPMAGAIDGYSDLFHASQETVNHYPDNEEPIPACVWESEPNFDTDNHRPEDSVNRISLSEADVNAILTDITINEGNTILVHELAISHKEQSIHVSNKDPDHINDTCIDNNDVTKESISKLKNSNCELKKHKSLRHKKFRRKSSFNQNESSSDCESDNSGRQQKKKYRKKKTNSVNSEHSADTSRTDDEIREIGIEDENCKSSNNIRKSAENSASVPNISDLSQDIFHSSPNKITSSPRKSKNSSPCKLVPSEKPKKSPSIDQSRISDSESNESINSNTKGLNIENQKNKENKRHSNSSVSSYVNQRHRENSRSSPSSSSHNKSSKSLPCAEKGNRTNDEVQRVSNNLQTRRNMDLVCDPSDSDSELVINESNENLPVESKTNDSVLCPPPVTVTSPLRIVKEPSVDGGYSSNVSSQIDDKASQNNEPFPSSQNEPENSMERIDPTLVNKESLESRSSPVYEKNKTSSAPSSSSSFFKNSKFIKPSQTMSSIIQEATKSKEVEPSIEIRSEGTSSNKLSENNDSISEKDPSKSYSSNEYSSDDELLPTLDTLKQLRRNSVQQLESEEKLSVRSKSPDSVSSLDFEETFVVENNKVTKCSKEIDSDDLSSSDEEVRNIISPKIVEQVDLASNINSDNDQDRSDAVNNVQIFSKSKRRKNHSRKDRSSDDDASSIQVLSCEQRLRKNDYSSDSSSNDDSIFSNEPKKELASRSTLDKNSTKKCNQNSLLKTNKNALSKISSSDDSSSGDDDITLMQVNNLSNDDHDTNENHISSDDDDNVSLLQENHTYGSSHDIGTKASPDDSSDLSSDDEIPSPKQSTVVQNHSNDSSDLSSDSDENRTCKLRKPRIVESYDISSDKDQSIKSNDSSDDDDSRDNKGTDDKINNTRLQGKALHYLSPDDSISSVDDVSYVTGQVNDYKNETDEEKEEIKMYNYTNDNKEDSIDVYTEKRELNESSVWVSLTQENNADSDWFQRRLDIEDNVLVENKLFDEVNSSSKKKSKKNREKKGNEIEAVEEDLNRTPKPRGRKSVRGTKQNDEAVIMEDIEVMPSPKEKRKSLNNANKDENELTTIVGSAKKKKGNSSEVGDLSTIENGNNDSMSKKKKKQDKINLNNSLSNKSLHDTSEIEELNNSKSMKKNKKEGKKNRSFNENEIVDNQSLSKSKDRKSINDSAGNNSCEEKDLDQVEYPNDSISKKKNKKNRGSFTITNVEEMEDDEGEDNNSLIKNKRTKEANLNQVEDHNDSMTKKKKKQDKMNLNNSLSNISLHDTSEIEELNNSKSIKKSKTEGKKNRSFNESDEIADNQSSKSKDKKIKNDSARNNSFEEEDLHQVEDHNDSISKKKNKKNRGSFTITNVEEMEDDEGGDNDSLIKNKTKKEKSKNKSLDNISFGEIDTTINGCYDGMTAENEIDESLSKKKSKKNKINDCNNSYEDEKSAEELEVSVSKKKKNQKKTALDEDEVSLERSLKKALKRKREDQSMNNDSVSDDPIKKKKKKPLDDSLQEEHTPVSISHLPSHFLQDLASVKPHSSIRKHQKKIEKTKKKFKFIEKPHISGSDFIPLETSTSTKFGVVPLNVSSYGCHTVKGDFKQNMLFGNNIRRTSSQQLKAINMKRKVKMQ